MCSLCISYGTGKRIQLKTSKHVTSVVVTYSAYKLLLSVERKYSLSSIQLLCKPSVSGCTVSSTVHVQYFVYFIIQHSVHCILQYNVCILYYTVQYTMYYTYSTMYTRLNNTKCTLYPHIQ